MFITLKHNKYSLWCSCLAGATAPVAPGAAPPLFCVVYYTHTPSWWSSIFTNENLKKLVPTRLHNEDVYPDPDMHLNSSDSIGL
jgi:hypothetical protein